MDVGKGRAELAVSVPAAQHELVETLRTHSRLAQIHLEGRKMYGKGGMSCIVGPFSYSGIFSCPDKKSPRPNTGCKYGKPEQKLIFPYLIITDNKKNNSYWCNSVCLLLVVSMNARYTTGL